MAGQTFHEKIEQNVPLMVVLVIVVVSIAGLIEIVPLFFQRSTTEPVAGLKPYTALELEGRDVYIREGCYNCHSQMIRPFRAETERYGHYSVAGEYVYDHPFQWGSKRTGPDLARVTPRKMIALRRVGVPYTDAQIDQASEAVTDKTEMDAMIAYLQMLGTAVRTR
jgi:cytochrome c oxidase cbb3-type subunit 2